MKQILSILLVFSFLPRSICQKTQIVDSSSLFSKKGAYNIFPFKDGDEIKRFNNGGEPISFADADKMIHNYDIWFRNRGEYTPDGIIHPATRKPIIFGPKRKFPHDNIDPNEHGRAADVSCGAGNDSLSKSVWFDKDVIKFLANLLDTSTQNLDGIRIYFASYSKKEQDSQTKAHQATLIIVPTSPGTLYYKCKPVSPEKLEGHQDRYDIIQTEAEKQKRLQRKSDGNALNHGELCPDNCPEEVSSIKQKAITK